MGKGRRHLLLGGRQRHPHLQAVQVVALGAALRAGALGMHDAAARGHPVDLAGPDRRRGAEAVAVHDLAVEQIGDGGKPDMRMRPHVEAVAGAKFRRPEMIEEDEGPDHARARRRQRAAHREAVAEIDRARHHHLLDRLALILVAGGRVLAWEETHDCASTVGREMRQDMALPPAFGKAGGIGLKSWGASGGGAPCGPVGGRRSTTPGS